MRLRVRWSSQGLWALLGKPSPEDAAPLFQGSPRPPFPSLGPRPLGTPVLCQLDGTRLQPLKPGGHVSTPPIYILSPKIRPVSPRNFREHLHTWPALLSVFLPGLVLRCTHTGVPAFWFHSLQATVPHPWADAAAGGSRGRPQGELGTEAGLQGHLGDRPAIAHGSGLPQGWLGKGR